jgi:hypothetical protein
VPKEGVRQSIDPLPKSTTTFFCKGERKEDHVLLKLFLQGSGRFRKSIQALGEI